LRPFQLPTQENPPKKTKPSSIYRGKLAVHGRAQQHWQPCKGAQSCHSARSVAQQHGLATWLCCLVHGRACSRSLPFALLGLRLTSILPSIPLESYFSHQNPKILSESTDKPQYKHN